MTWLPKKAILPRLPANKFLSALRKLTTGPISFDMTKKTPFCDMQIRWFISHLQTFQYTCTTNLHIVSWCMGVAMLCLGWLEFGGAAPSCFTLSCSTLLFMEMSHTKPEDQTTEQAPPTDNHAHTNQRRGGRREAATLLTATILLKTPHYLADWTLSVPAIEKNESCPNTVTQLIRSRFTKNTHIYI